MVWTKITDGEMVDSYKRIGNNIYFSEFNYLGFDDRSYDSLCLKRQKPISTDAAHFSVCKGTGYARDLEYVYFPMCIEAFDVAEKPADADCEREYFLTVYIVEDANPKYFKYVKDGYGVDRWNMYKEGINISWDDSIFETE